MNDEKITGVTIERGKIVSESGGSYCVQSMTRYGIVTPLINPIDNKVYSVGDTVYFFMFPDGNGKIIAAIS